jgi:hypothetical protein
MEFSSREKRKEEDAVVAGKQRIGNSKEKGFPLKYTCIRRNMGRDVAYRAKAASPLMREKYGNLPRYPCASVSVRSNQSCERSRHTIDVTISPKERY